MTHNAIAALRQTLQTANVAQTSLPSDSRTALDPRRSYVATYVLGGDLVARTLGGATGTNTFNGVFQIDVYLPSADGDGAVNAVAQTLLAAYSPHVSHTYAGATARCNRVASQPTRVVGGHYVLTLTLYWEATINR